MKRNKTVDMGYVVFLSFVAAIGGFLYGYDTAVISGTISMVSARFSLDAISTGWYVGCALVGSIGGVACAGVMSDRLGRRLTMFVSAILFTVSAIGCMFAPSFDMLVAYRIIGGVGIGVVSVVSPLYISEVAVASYRGSLVSAYQLAITVGFLGAYIANYELLQYAPGLAGCSAGWIANAFSDEVWRGMLGLEAVPAVIFIATCLAIPESPRWLMLRHREAGASSILRRIYPRPADADKELDSIRESLSQEPRSQWKELFRPGIRRAVVVGVLIAILGQFMGVNAVLYYGPAIFEDAGLSSGDSLFYQVLVGSVNVATTVIALVIIDRVGRKKLVYFGVSGMIISLLLIAGYFIGGKAVGMVPVALLAFFLAYIFCCAISICAVIFVLLSEMYPTKVRGLAMSIAGFSLWIGTYLIGQLTPWLLDKLTPAGTFILFAMMCVPYLIIIRYFVPETTGLSLEQIEGLWQKGKHKNR